MVALSLTADDARASEDLTLVFLRHRGCLFTRELVEAARDAAGSLDSHVVLVHQASCDEYDRVLAPLWPEADHVSDPDAELYQAFAIERGGMRAMFGLRSWLAGIPAFLHGHRIGWKGKADGWTLPTAIRLRRGTVVWEHRGSHAGDQPDFAAAAAVASADSR